jgi:Concanavalin A-like lectin/glucanases superfamily
MQQIFVLDKRTGKKKLVNVPSYTVMPREISGWSVGGGYNDYVNSLSPTVYYDFGSKFSYPYNISISSSYVLDLSSNKDNASLTSVSWSNQNVGVVNFTGSTSGSALFSLPQLTNYTLFFWVRPTNTGSLPMQVLSTSGSVGVNIVNSGSFTYFNVNNGTNDTDTTKLNLNTWYNLTVTNTSGSNTNIYINGSLDSTFPNSGNIVSGSAALGYKLSTTSSFFTGNIGSFAVFPSVLSPSDITLIYTQFAQRYGY